MSSNILFCALSMLLFVLLIASEVRHKFIEKEQVEIIKRQRMFIEAQRLIIKMYEKKERAMGSGMDTEQAKEYAKKMTYSEAVSNVKSSKGVKYRKATMIKLRELAEIADRLDKADTSQTDCPVAIVFGCDECHRPKCDYKNCRRCKWFVTDKCLECFGNELFEDSGYVTQTERSE